ncbi:hypothetical protein ISN76_04780 [Dyella halodurans]|uniref:Uncharacterized protein n=1 Tax=Dyella halodurans TaxID=1920171 RepID=A0ABV9C168_9GAMM|nr:hypothetical protein [Dyella halodurans]
MYQLKFVTFLAGLILCSYTYASGVNTPAPAEDATNPAASPCNAGALAIARFELRVVQDGKTEADLMASPSVCGPGARIGIHHIPSVAIDSRQVDPSNALDVELSIEPVGRPGPFLVSLETRHLDTNHPIQTAPGMATANVATRSWSGVVSLKPGEELTILKDGGQIATVRRVQ